MTACKEERDEKYKVSVRMCLRNLQGPRSQNPSTFVFCHVRGRDAFLVPGLALAGGQHFHLLLILLQTQADCGHGK